jgi:hypothetical protein
MKQCNDQHILERDLPPGKSTFTVYLYENGIGWLVSVLERRTEKVKRQ